MEQNDIEFRKNISPNGCGVEVTEEKFKKLMHDFSGIVAGRNDGDKYYIKMMIMQYFKYVKKAIES